MLCFLYLNLFVSIRVYSWFESSYLSAASYTRDVDAVFE